MSRILVKADQLDLFGVHPVSVRGHARLTETGFVPVSPHVAERRVREDRRRAARLPRFTRDLEVFQGLREGSIVKVHKHGSGWAAYGDKPDGQPQASELYSVVPNDDRGLGSIMGQGDQALELRRESGGARTSTLLIRPKYATALLINRDRNGAHTSGHWVHLETVEQDLVKASEQLGLFREGPVKVRAHVRRTPTGVVPVAFHVRRGHRALSVEDLRRVEGYAQSFQDIPAQVAEFDPVKAAVKARHEQEDRDIEALRAITRTVSPEATASLLRAWSRIRSMVDAASAVQSWVHGLDGGAPYRAAEAILQRALEQPTVLSMFTGAGGDALGFEQAGFRHVAMVERDEHALATLRAAVRKRFLSGEVVAGDVNTLDFSRWRGMVDVLAGGPPCQPFSKAGKLRGKFDKRDGWPAFLRAVREIQPRHVVAENVANLMSPRFEGYRQAIEEELVQAGYTCTWSPIDAADYGVGQSRKRVLLVAHRADATPWTLPAPREGEAGRPASEVLDGIERMGMATADLQHPPPSGLEADWLKKHPPTDLVQGDEPARTVLARHGAGTVNLVRVDDLSPGMPVMVDDDEEPGLERAMGSSYYESLPEEGASDAEIEAWEAKFDQVMAEYGITWGRGQVDGVVVEDRGPTVIVDLGQGPEAFPRLHVYGYETTIRRAPTAWLATLQGFPEDYPFQGGLNARGAQIGNAIPVGLAQAIAASWPGRGER